MYCKNKYVRTIYGPLRISETLPLLTTGVFVFAFNKLAFNIAEHMDLGATSQEQVVERTQHLVGGLRLASYIDAVLGIYIVASIRWMWHKGMCRIVDRTRPAEIRSRDASWHFFLLHTSSCAFWMGLMMLGFAYITAYNFKEPFQTVDNFVNNHVLLAGALCLPITGMMNTYMRTSRFITHDIYITKWTARIVRGTSWVVVFALPVALLFGLKLVESHF